MKFILEKWINNKTDATFKRIFNDNVDKINALANYFKKRESATNSRIDNLVLRSGGPSHNEVVDARVDYLGVSHDTLKGRLDADWKYIEDKFEAINQKHLYYDSTIKTLFDTLEKLYTTIGEPVRIFVSEKRGSNISGDGTEEKPFKTIQKAADLIPAISSANYFIMVEPGAYLEDVFINNKFSRSIEIIATNLATAEPDKNDTGVYVREVNFYNCPNYCGVRGFTQTDAINSQDKRFVSFTAVEYGVVDRCRAVANTKAIDAYETFYFDRTKGHVYSTHASNQKLLVESIHTSTVRISSSLTGSANDTVLRAEASIIYAAKLNVTGTTAEVKNSGGQIFKD